MYEEDDPDAKKKKHTSLYLPEDLEIALNEYCSREFGTPYGRNRVIIAAIREYLERN